MNKITFWALKYGPIAAGGLMFILPHGGLAQTSTITCTAAPDCASLGYTKSIDQCPDGGMRCPFDQSKMFCVSAENVDFVFKNEIAVGHIVYSDGSTSASYNASKLPIGIVVYVHPNGKKNHGLVLAIDAPLPMTRDEANIYCNGYSTQGTKSGDWHLPSAGEVWMYSSANPNYTFNQFNNYLGLVPQGDTLEYVYSAFLGYSSSYQSFCNKHYHVAGNCQTGSRFSYSLYPWSNTDNYTVNANYILPHIHENFKHSNANYKNYYNNFRCVADF